MGLTRKGEVGGPVSGLLGRVYLSMVAPSPNSSPQIPPLPPVAQNLRFHCWWGGEREHWWCVSVSLSVCLCVCVSESLRLSLSLSLSLSLCVCVCVCTEADCCWTAERAQWRALPPRKISGKTRSQRRFEAQSEQTTDACMYICIHVCVCVDVCVYVCMHMDVNVCPRVNECSIQAFVCLIAWEDE